ncbi:radical SAM/SPASM domain-containing protein [Clostridium saccharobutylicum]|uniref:Radical SAM additional 4Fe4S-binding domain containing protein n=1 Tax=Clostridium saccharobutylicum DSM 13864 TaxID=1345695 RepID=U5MU01_CLOSA|nr:radical SAM protein [Clostridium saccharobutylicum]AGX42887.1 radical SAM additional 4Fe4S-binding domain containing protein [Clostridium saccharobutylicum DSM 13864]AQR90182.1 antilisterial bacteriocin subtilosin biosynthesis protein AlbA [Clostridium saccharobutylicum]AQS00088.1 antilisterial bacteriocin subtilosin biosynthesis protein AlbA [Clostridium saccharobutylicum]AQS09875.1 antilisterial bacteriocin subtilosin biosynthesis protein AlbA [Clostridium saccharobutylicum]AQS14071.1 ant
MKKLILQWHITNRCNKRCRHCYQENYNGTEFSINELIEFGNQYIKLLLEYNKFNNQNLKGQINITGGEPFIREDIWQLLDFFKQNNKYFDFGILTNGSLLNDENVKKLKSYNPKMIQVSLDGNKKTHDIIRGKNSYDEVINSLKLLKKYKIKSLVSFTANNENYREFRSVVRTAKKYKSYKVWTDRMVPVGAKSNGDIKTLNKESVINYIDMIRIEQKNFLNKFYKTKISGERSLQFLNGVSNSYRCSVGDGLIVLLENGNVMPCRRLPIVAGNILDSSLSDIYFNSKVFNDLRNYKEVPIGCEKCSFLDTCNGGAKCISYGIYGDYKHGDYGCMLNSET